MVFSQDELETCIRVLEALVADRLRLAELSDEQRRLLLIAAGRVSRPERDQFAKLGKARRRKRRERLRGLDREAKARTAIRAARQSTVYEPPLRLGAAEIAARPRLCLQRPRQCYVCKVEFSELHFFYDAMCGGCGDFNYSKRFQSCSLHGKVAVITGARVKIGYQAALMMLRAGAKVIVTTRFPRDAAKRFASEGDFGRWAERLEIYGLDLRHSFSVELFSRYLNDRLGRLDLLINNAAQTVRRPAGFYAHLMKEELRPIEALPAPRRGLLQPYEECKARLARGLVPLADASPGITRRSGPGDVGLRAPAEISQLDWSEEQTRQARELFPDGKFDTDLQQVDLRRMNSWRMTLSQVPTPEMIEVQLVNSIAPFILCSRLKPLMMRDRTGEKHIINVSAMEGKFSRHTKTDKHPHTNMAKAALNMMTLTSAPEYAADGIFMNAVDTGWVTDEDPAIHVERKRDEHDFQPPLDIVDGAARICDPFFSGLLSGDHVWGKFLKDYRPTEW